ncbi:sugar phosphate nucleotidyltransferase [Natrarchaeobaculum sulfurireducens]|uniref:Glucose-1-phosphate uridyltransferase n=1 Tax=Natrarchaeobaculum sulfurireducens TaxID=2044521 RepID=A0A346PCF9_9EURY|nr:sugar phosphate nucleotidyltransferase [Natrarchaeobaculum sulfurireducens]AXR77204.1 Glucose-1-phosphate uridyltransferase [Natrarchaeobaculum sulfurireducens]
MDAIVFAAGRGSRLRPFTDGKPKPLLEVGGKPLLARCLDALVAVDVDQIVLVVGYRADQIVETVGDSYEDVPIVYAHQHDRKGLAHAVCRAAEDGYSISLSSRSSDAERTLPSAAPTDVLTVNGDNVFDDCALSRLATDTPIRTSTGRSSSTESRETRRRRRPAVS